MRHNLSDTNELIRDRRTIAPEKYSSRRVHREVVEEVLRNGTWAPTHGMTQPWRFKVFIGDGVKRIAEQMPHWYKNFVSEEKFSQKKFEKLEARGEKCSVIVAVTMVPDPNERIPEIEEVEAVACAVQNMYLTCAAHGIGALYSTPRFIYSEEVSEFLGLEEGAKCLGLFYMGYPEGEWPKSHRKPLEYVTEWIEE
ncbi:MAG: nitroreductase [Crocinitomicaceae bacterium]|nr:nitroreductase [Crocinitomicaceae bacterium]